MNMTPERKKKLTKWLIGIATACILIFLGVQNIGRVANAFSWCMGIIMPLVIGCAIALIINVPMGFLEKQLWKKSANRLGCKARRPVAFLLALLFVIGIFVGVVAIVLPTLIDTVTVIVKSAIDLVNRFNSMSESEIAALPFGEMLMDVDWNNLLESAKSWLVERASVITGTVFGTITAFFGGIMDLFVSIVFAVYILFSKEKLKNQTKRVVRAWFPDKFGKWSCHAVSVLNVNLKNFISAQFFEAIILGFLCFIGMLIFRFPYAAMVSVLVGVTALVPIVGGFIGCGIGAFMMLTVDPMKAVWFLVFFIVLQQLEGNIIYPRVMGSRVNLPGMWILAAVTVGGGLGGPIGMLLSVPIASTTYTLFKEATKKRELGKASSEKLNVKTKAVLFDLDGTLLPMNQDVFLNAYIEKLVKIAARHGYNSKKMKDAITSGTVAMIRNDGKRTNEEAFWSALKEMFGESVTEDFHMFDRFYRTGFQKIKDVCGFDPRAKEVIERAKRKGLRTALATNPMFPEVATSSRIRWAGLEPGDFEFFTSYENSCYSKPSLDYYREVASKLGVDPSECLMIGNDVSDDMIASQLGMKVFLLTDCMINSKNEDISVYPNGDFDALLAYIEGLN